MEHYEINLYYLIIIFKKAGFKCKSDIVKFSEQSVGRRWKTSFLVFVANMAVFSFALLNNRFWAPVSQLAKIMNFKFIVLISNLSQYLCKQRILLKQL
jgi:hypothetical protein